MKIATTQISRLHILYQQLHMTEDARRAMIAGVTNGRTNSTSGLTQEEAFALIDDLNKLAHAADPADVMRKKILSMCHRMKWETAEGKVDMERLNDWCVKSSYEHKPLKWYKYNELPQLVSQFQQVYKSYL